jgi:hypothetical protein
LSASEQFIHRRHLYRPLARPHFASGGEIGEVGWKRSRHSPCWGQRPSSARSVQTPRAERMLQPLVVWHLHRRPDQDIWCLVTKVDGCFGLCVSQSPDDPTGPTSGNCADVVSLVRHAEDLKQTFLDSGWREPSADRKAQPSRAEGRLVFGRPFTSTKRDDPTWAEYCRLEARTLARGVA